MGRDRKKLRRERFFRSRQDGTEREVLSFVTMGPVLENSTGTGLRPHNSDGTGRGAVLQNFDGMEGCSPENRRDGTIRLVP